MADIVHDEAGDLQKKKKRKKNSILENSNENLGKKSMNLEKNDFMEEKGGKKRRKDEKAKSGKMMEKKEKEKPEMNSPSENLSKNEELKDENFVKMENFIQEQVSNLLKSDNEALNSLFNEKNIDVSKFEKANTKAPPILPWMRFPVELQSVKPWPITDVPLLDKRLKKALNRLEYRNLFPVQISVWRELVGPGAEARDLCICSPTGSGKTLAYALPIVQNLKKSEKNSLSPRKLRALVVLPTRDLATQVKSVFDSIATDVDLTVGLSIGQTSLPLESSKLVVVNEDEKYLPWREEDGGAKSLVDILIATPGRLMDHIQSTKGFTLKYLKYLVVDETDRLLRQSYQDWLPSVLSFSENENPRQTAIQSDSAPSNPNLPDRISSNHESWADMMWNPGHFSDRNGDACVLNPTRVVKIVLSATLTRDPLKISRLCLFHPLYISSDAHEHRYRLPKELKEYKLVCPPNEKPLYLLALLRHLKTENGNEKEKIIVFSSSVQSTHRLFLLLKCMSSVSLESGFDFDFDFDEYSSHNHQNQRTLTMDNFRSGKVNVLICSDAVARGVDVENVSSVVSYDCPVYAKTFVHRAGRTARAGNKGKHFTMLRKEEVHHFKQMLRKLDNNYCKDFKLSSIGDVIQKMKPMYIQALEKFKQAVVEETNKKLLQK